MVKSPPTDDGPLLPERKLTEPLKSLLLPESTSPEAIETEPELPSRLDPVDKPIEPLEPNPALDGVAINTEPVDPTELEPLISDTEPPFSAPPLRVNAAPAEARSERPAVIETDPPSLRVFADPPLIATAPPEEVLPAPPEIETIPPVELSPAATDNVPPMPSPRVDDPAVAESGDPTFAALSPTERETAPALPRRFDPELTVIDPEADEDDDPVCNNKFPLMPSDAELARSTDPFDPLSSCKSPPEVVPEPPAIDTDPAIIPEPAKAVTEPPEPNPLSELPATSLTLPAE